MGVRRSVTSSSLSAAVHGLKGDGVIDSDAQQGRCYSMWLLGELTPATVVTLNEYHNWAINAVNGVAVPRPTSKLVIMFKASAKASAEA